MGLGLPEDVVRDVVARALAEDIGAGDLTTLRTVDAEARCRAGIEARANGVIAGLPIARQTFLTLDPSLTFQELLRDGEHVSAGAVVAQLAGSTRAVLAAERTALNFLQRMSGIATLTADYVAAVKGTRTRIVDTRKTAPGLRLLDDLRRRPAVQNDLLLHVRNHPQPARQDGGIGEVARVLVYAQQRLIDLAPVGVPLRALQPGAVLDDQVPQPSPAPGHSSCDRHRPGQLFRRSALRSPGECALKPTRRPDGRKVASQSLPG